MPEDRHSAQTDELISFDGILPAALILAAGESSRFWPLSDGRHKCLYSLAGTPILERTVRSLISVGFRDIVIVESPRTGSGGQQQVLPSDIIPATLLGSRVRFVEQTTAAGQGDAILRAAALLPEWFVVIQPESINAGDIAADLVRSHDPSDLVTVGAQARADFQLLAVVEHDGRRLTGIVEKPATASSPEPLCNMGVYFMNHEFIGTIGRTEPSQLSLIDAISEAATLGRAATTKTDHLFFPLKYPGHLWAYGQLVDLTNDLPGPAGKGRVLTEGDCWFGDVSLDNVVMGRRVVIGSGTYTASSGDDLDCVVIGEGVTIGSDVRLEPRVRIGNGATVPSGSRVTADIPAATVTGA